MMKQGPKNDQMMANMMIMKKDLTGKVTGALAAVSTWAGAAAAADHHSVGKVGIELHSIL